MSLLSPNILSVGQSYWVFDAERQITGPDSVRRLGLTVNDIQAALMWGEDKAQKIYFFKKGSYWRFNLKENRVDNIHPRSMRDWRGIPSDIDAAFQDRFGMVVTETWTKFTCAPAVLCKLLTNCNTL